MKCFYSYKYQLFWINIVQVGSNVSVTFSLINEKIELQRNNISAFQLDVPTETTCSVDKKPEQEKYTIAISEDKYHIFL